jgi:hypothetical protein
MSKNTTEKEEKIDKSKEYLQRLLSQVIKKYFTKEEHVKYVGYLSMHLKAPNGKCFGDGTPEDIREEVVNTVNNSIALFVNNKYSIKDCGIYGIELLDLHYSIKVTILRMKDAEEAMIKKKNFDKLKDGCYFIGQVFLKIK